MTRSLVAAARDGDHDAFDRLVREHLEPMYRRALAILGNEADAQDATQETFVAAWRNLRSLRDLDRFDAWLGRILVNQCRMGVRRNSRLRVLRLSSGPDPLETPDPRPAIADEQASADAFDRAFDRLSVDERAILVLHHLEGRPVADVAASLGVPIGTVKSRLHTARSALERALSRENR